MCYAAADRLLNDNNIDRSTIDLLVVITETPDYKMPTNGCLLQERLGLPTQVMTMDLNLGCPGFLYGLSTVYALMQQPNFRRALLLVGETKSKVYSCRDRRSAFIFGDSASAVLIEKDEKFGTSYFSLNSDGSRHNLIMIKAGGYRHPSSVETVVEKVIDEYGNMRSDEQGYMEGGDVFNFVIREIPKDIKALVAHAEQDINTLDYYVFHQANAFINTYITKKLKLDQTRIPESIHQFGNTGSVSLPLTMTTELQNKMQGSKNVLMSSFGVGLMWGTAIVPFVDCHISDLVEI